MGEKANGRDSFTRRDHGSERRGVFPVQDLPLLVRQAQSREDRARVLEKIREQHVAKEEGVVVDFGNHDLPAYKHKQEILANVEAYNAIILGGPTGSGKSTQLPQYLYEAGYDKTFILVPRRVIADGLTDRIREEMSAHIGEDEAAKTVGVVHGERTELSDDNRIVVMTPNTYTRMEKDIRAQYANAKVAIVSDEIHEANLFTEIATGVAAMGVRDNKDWRLIAASATHNADSLRASLAELNNGYVPVVDIEGRPFEVDIREEPELSPMEVYRKMGEEHQRSMLFTSGKREIDHIIDETIRELESDEQGSSKNVVFRKLHAELSEVEMSHINDPVPEGQRVVIVASPAGMSGITIPGVTLVITDGTINRQELDADGIPGLVRHPLSHAEIIQQMGRAGRDVAGGIGVLAKPIGVIEDHMKRRGKFLENPDMPYIPLSERKPHAPPEIYHSNLSRVVLSVAALDRRFGDINPYIPHPVAQSAIINAEESLYRLGALDEDDKVTSIGIGMDLFPLSPELSRGLVEVRRQGRPLQHLARAAFIAAAVDVGGLQDFSHDNAPTWKRLLRPTTADDFVAQLDLMLAVNDNATKGDEPLRYLMESFNLHPKRVERAMKLSRKVLQSLKVELDNLIVTPPLPDEETLLRDDMSSGMIDLVYEEVERYNRRVRFKNIHGDESATRRRVSGRSVYKPVAGQLVAGIPRWFEKRNKQGELERHDVIEMTLKVDPAVIGRYAAANNLLAGKLVSPRMDGDRIVEREQMTFGSITVGEPVTTVWREHIPSTSQKELVREALQRPGEAQRALRAIADELALYHKTIPAAELTYYQEPASIPDITKQFIQDLIFEQTKYTRSLSEIDSRIAEHMYRKNITIHRFYNDAARLELQQRSPESITIGGSESRVYYDSGRPYITRLSDAQRQTLTGPIRLEDGREVLVQVPVEGGGTVRVSATQL